MARPRRPSYNDVSAACEAARIELNDTAVVEVGLDVRMDAEEDEGNEERKVTMNREIPIRITKAVALDRFINERVLGDRGFGYDPEIQACRYSHANNGGCEIGQYLSAQVAENLTGACYTTDVIKAMVEAGFEDPESDFWFYLQRAHDLLAEGDLPVFQRYLEWLEKQI